MAATSTAAIPRIPSRATSPVPSPRILSVTKRADPEDARRVVVGLTAKGRALRDEAVKVPEALVCRLLAEGGPEAAVRVERLRQQLKQLVNTLSFSLEPREDQS